MRGVFVTGTDTGVGKTLVSAVLCRAWGADYFKPLQTGLAEEAGDTPTVTGLAGLTPDRVHPPVYALQAPLSPHAAAELEGVSLDATSLRLPQTERPLVVEGAGGVLVPVAADCLMIDLIARFGLSAVVVARSTLGTINHTLLTLEALRRRGCAVAGVVMNGPRSPGNVAAVETFGRVRVLFEVHPLSAVTTASVAELEARVPTLSALT